MHPFAVIPLSACLGACVVASAIVNLDPRPRASGAVGGLLAITSCAALLEVMWSIGAVAEREAVWLMRVSGVMLLGVGPLALRVALELGETRVARWQRWAVGTAVGIGLLYLATPGFVAAAAPTVWGFRIHAGPIFWLASAHTALCGLAGALILLRSAAIPERVRRGPLLVFAVCLPTALWTADAVSHQLGAAVTRLTPLAPVIAGAVFWLLSRSRNAGLTPSAFAREILDTLPDGVALLRNDGRVRTVNLRFAAMVEHTRDELVGRSVDAVLSLSPRDAAAGVHERGAMLSRSAGPSLPVSISSSVLRDREGGAIGSAVALSDESEVVDLERQLVASARLAAVGELAAGIAHEVNNPLAYIQANLNQLQRHCAELEQGPELGERERDALRAGAARIQHCLEGIARVASIVRDVRGFAHGGDVEVDSGLRTRVKLPLPERREGAPCEDEMPASGAGDPDS